MRTKVQSLTDVSVTSMNKRKRAAPSNVMDKTHCQDSHNTVKVIREAKSQKQVVAKETTEQKLKTTNGKIEKADVKRLKKSSAAMQEKKTPHSPSSSLEKIDPWTEQDSLPKNIGAIQSHSITKKSPSGACKRTSPDFKTSHPSHQPKVQKIETEIKHQNKSNKKSKTVPASSVNYESGKKEKGKAKLTSKSSLPLEEDNENSSSVPKAVDLSDPLAMLMMMEGRAESVPGKSSFSAPSLALGANPSSSTPKASSSRKTLKRRQISKHTDEDSSGSEGLSDWEDVRDHSASASPKKSQVPDGPVEITLDVPDILKHKKRKKKEFDWKLYLERRVRRFKKEVAINKHKVHLLCLLSVGLRQNEELNDLTLSGLVMSVMPSRLASVIGDVGSTALERRVEAVQAWYKRTFPLEHVKLCSNINLVLASRMAKCVSEGVISDARIWVLVFICILRTLGLSVRLVLSFHAVSYKASQEIDKPGSSGTKQPKVNKVVNKPRAKKSNNDTSSSSQKSSPKTPLKDQRQPSKGKDVKSKKDSAVSRKRLSRASSEVAKKNFKESDGESDGDDDAQDDKVAKSKKQKKKTIITKTKSPKKDPRDDESLPGKILSASSGDEEDSTINRSTIAGHDFWLELYFPEKRKWICFDTFKCQFGKPYSLENSATQPLTYVVAFNNDGGVKDVTARYAKLWLSHTRKQRVDQDWWEESLSPFNTTPHAANMEEDDEIKGKLLVRPIPTSIADLKNHPLYALRRHLLKFEAIYPDTAIPLGYIKQEPIYARECVRTLHSRDNWLKEGRMVRLAEQPYKMVKSRPKWNKPKDNPDELDLELYGEWQTDKYIPPPAVNGKVPKNEYGNVELFKPWMLPLGTVQLKVNGLQRIARKLGIDVAPAMVGWDHHSGRSHPMFDGVIVCEEFADTLMEAWTEDQDIQEQRETEKREKRVYGNWRLLIRGLLIKSRLAEKFSQVDLNVKDKKERLLKRVEELKKQEEIEEEKAFAKAEPAQDVQQSWPRRQQDEVHKKKMKNNKLKIEAAKSLLEKRPEQIDKQEIDITKAGERKNRSEDLKSTPKVERTKSIVSVTKNKIQRNFGSTGRKRQTLKAGMKSGNSQKAKPIAKHKGKKSEDEDGSDSSDSEDDFEDEVDGEIEVATAKVTSRPKRRSVTAVKYFDSGDEEAEDFVDDSDNDQDFEQELEGHKKRKKIRTSRLLDDDGVSKDELKGKFNIGNKPLETVKTGETSRHWLDSEGSSSDEDDFLAVEPEPLKDTPIHSDSEIKDIIINFQSDGISEQSAPNTIGKVCELTKMKERNTETCSGNDDCHTMTSSNPQIPFKLNQESVGRGKKRQGRNNIIKAPKQVANLSSEQVVGTVTCSVSIKETIGKDDNFNEHIDTYNVPAVTSPKKGINQNGGESKSIVGKSRGSRSKSQTKETDSKRKSLRITRQTS